MRIDKSKLDPSLFAMLTVLAAAGALGYALKTAPPKADLLLLAGLPVIGTLISILALVGLGYRRYRWKGLVRLALTVALAFLALTDLVWLIFFSYLYISTTFGPPGYRLESIGAAVLLLLGYLASFLFEGIAIIAGLVVFSATRFRRSGPPRSSLITQH